MNKKEKKEQSLKIELVKNIRVETSTEPIVTSEICTPHPPKNPIIFQPTRDLKRIFTYFINR